MKKEFLTKSIKIQEIRNNLLVTIPASIKSIMGFKKGDEVEFVAYDDRTVEIRLKKGE